MMKPPVPYSDPILRQTSLGCWAAFVLLGALFAYLHFRQPGHGCPPLDRWVYHNRGGWLLREPLHLPVLTIASGLAGILFSYFQHRQRLGLAEDIFNKDGESFPQEEKKRTHPYSVNLPMLYWLNGKRRKGWINILQPFRGLLVMGTPGSGKTYFIIRPLLAQQIEKGFTLFVYDYKFDDLSRHVYNHLRRNEKAYPVKPSFFLIHFDDLARSHRCNPLDPATLSDLSEAGESARAILLGLNREWIRRQGDFFVESAINLLTALIWFLKKYRKGICCTLPHAIELMQVPYEKLFSALRTEPQIAFLIDPFVTAYLAGVMPQLEGQIAGAKISLARLSAPPIYYVLSGNDFTLDINNPSAPKIVCMGNTPAKQQVYGAVISLYVSRLVRLVNQKDRLPCSLVFDEFPTLYFNGMDSLLATARSNRVAATIAIQDMSQLRKEYGREQSEVLLNITGNIISGQVSGDSARAVSERFGRIWQEHYTTHTSAREQSVAVSRRLEMALPGSRIANLSAGEMVGILADSPDEEVALKMFHGKMGGGPGGGGGHAGGGSRAGDVEIPLLAHPPDASVVEENYARIKQEVQEIVQDCLAQILNQPGMGHLAIRKKI